MTRKNTSPNGGNPLHALSTPAGRSRRRSWRRARQRHTRHASGECLPSPAPGAREKHACMHIARETGRAARVKSICQKWTNLTVARLSLNCSQCGGCSNKLRHPDRDLGRLRMIWRLHVAWGGSGTALPAALGRLPGKGCTLKGLCRRGRRRTVGPRVSLPPEAGALKLSSHVWAGFWLRGVQP